MWKEDNLTERNYAISLIRIISVVFIITCHIQQYFEMELAWWFNVGVQIFLCISGFLYGNRNIENVVKFYKKRFNKILIPYWITLIIATIFQLMFAKSVFDILKFVGAVFCRTTIVGGDTYGLFLQF